MDQFAEMIPASSVRFVFVDAVEVQKLYKQSLQWIDTSTSTVRHNSSLVSMRLFSAWPFILNGCEQYQKIVKVTNNR